MEVSELYEQIYNCKKFLNEFYEKIICIFKYIKSESQYQQNLNAWNRFNHYEDSLSLKKCDWINGLQVPIFDSQIKKNGSINYWIRLEILCVFSDESFGEKPHTGWLLFLFTYQKDKTHDWTSWINPKEYDWIPKTLNGTYIVPRNIDEKLGNIESYFLAHALPLEDFFSYEKINSSLRKINDIVLNKTKKYCGVTIDNIFKS